MSLLRSLWSLTGVAVDRDRLADEVSYERMTSSLLSLKKLVDRPTDVMRVLFGMREPSFDDDGDDTATTTPMAFQNDSLNEPQKEAIRFAMRAREGMCTALGGALVAHL